VNKKSYHYIIALLGVIIVGYALFVYIISPDFTYAAKLAQENLINYIVVRILIGIVYTCAVIVIIRNQLNGNRILVLVFSVGFVARLILVPTEPILEDDYNRYLWDGAVTANGFNPYEYSPKLFIEGDSSALIAPQTLLTLADSSGVIIERINHPHIRTIYPTVAQLGFALAYLIKPWDVVVWKVLLIVIDLFVFLLLLLALKKIKLHLSLVVIYWWNPILLHEIFNAGHMDLLLYPFIVGAILFYFKGRIITSASLMALAVGVKIWPIIFIPFILKKIIKNKKHLITAIFTVSGIIIIILFPIIITKLDNSLGFITYSKNWTNNESVFRLINIFIKQLINIFQIDYHCSLCATRWIVILFLTGVVIYLLKSKEKKNYDFVLKLFYLVAIMYLISPTQFPWYYTWILVILVLQPRLSFVIYTIFLPLYQLKYLLPTLVWVEHIPIIILFVLEILYPKVGCYLTSRSGEKTP
jgi:alpha-1,6-mannosyltransferase